MLRQEGARIDFLPLGDVELHYTSLEFFDYGIGGQHYEVPDGDGDTIPGMTSGTPRTALPDRKTLAQWVIDAEERAELAEEARAEAEQHARVAREAATAKQLLTVPEAAEALRI